MCGQCYGGDLDCEHCEGSGYEPALPVHRPDLLEALIECAQRLRTCATLAGNDAEIVDLMMKPYEAVIARAAGTVWGRRPRL